MKASATVARTSNSRKPQPSKTAIERMMTRDLHAQLMRDATETLLKRCVDTDADHMYQLEDEIASAVPIRQLLDIVSYFSGAIERQVCRLTTNHTHRFEAVTLAHQAGVLSEVVREHPAIFAAKS